MLPSNSIPEEQETVSNVLYLPSMGGKGCVTLYKPSSSVAHTKHRCHEADIYLHIHIVAKRDHLAYKVMKLLLVVTIILNLCCDI